MARSWSIDGGLPVEPVILGFHQRARDAEFSVRLELQFRHKLDPETHPAPEQLSGLQFNLLEAPRAGHARGNGAKHDQIAALLDELILPRPIGAVAQNPISELVRMN